MLRSEFRDQRCQVSDRVLETPHTAHRCAEPRAWMTAAAGGMQCEASGVTSPADATRRGSGLAGDATGSPLVFLLVNEGVDSIDCLSLYLDNPLSLF